METDFLGPEMETLNGTELEALNELLAQSLNNSFGNMSFTDGLEAGMKLASIMNILNVYVAPIIIIIGIIGNTVSFLVYIGTPRLCRQSSSVYLAFLAAVDNVSLVSLFVVWFGWVGIHIFHKNGWCQTILYCTYVCSFLSVWTVVSFTCERWIVVFHPLKRHRLCTRKRAIIVMCALTISALAFYSFSIVTTQVRYMDQENFSTPVCAQADEHHGLLQVMRSLDTIVTVIIPPVAIIVMNTGIGIKTCRYANSKKSIETSPESVDDMFSGFSSGQRNSEVARQQQMSAISLVSQSTRVQSSTVMSSATKPRSWRFFTRRQQTQLRITRALLIVSSVFILLNLPSYAFRIHAFIMSMRNEAYKISLSSYIWQEFIQFLYCINFSCNFFLYCACSRNFRFALKRLLNRLRRRLSKLGTLSHGLPAHGRFARATAQENYVVEQPNIPNQCFK